MSYGLIDYNTLKDISNSIRFKTGSNRNYYPHDMARAINQIKTGDSGFDEPTILKFPNNMRPAYPNANETFGFEFINTPINNEQEYLLISDDYSIPVLSPDKVSLYLHHNTYGQWYAFQVDGERWQANQVSIMDISNIFEYDGYLRNAYCGKYTVNMRGTYKSCGSLSQAVCGPSVSDMSECYRYCSNIEHAVCSDSVKNMSHAYESCSNLSSAIIGNNVEDLSFAYAYCYNLTGNIVIPPTVKNISEAFCGCNNLSRITGDTSNVVNADNGLYSYIDTDNVFVDWNNFTWEKLKFANNLFNNRQDITDIDDFPSLQFGAYMFAHCSNLTDVYIRSNNLINTYGMFLGCYNLTQESHDNIIANLNANSTNMSWMFAYCEKIKNVYIFKNMITNEDVYSQDYANVSSMYAGVPIENVIVDENLNTMGSILQSSNIIDAVWPEHITQANYTYGSCARLVNAACGSNVTNMQQTYYGCPNLVNAVCGPNVVNMYATYQNCANLRDAVCGPNVISMQQTYWQCNNLINAACGPNVQTMFQTYYMLPNLLHVEIGNNVTNLYGTFMWSNNIIDDIELNNAQLNFIGTAFNGCYKIQNIVIKSENLPGNNVALGNAFNRSSYSLRRNIVLTNLNSWNNFVFSRYNALGSGISLSGPENYADPIDVYVNNVAYQAVRCSYSAYYNVYVYCTE